MVEDSEYRALDEALGVLGRTNERRREALLHAISQLLPRDARVQGMAAGLHLVLWLPWLRRSDETALCELVWRADDNVLQLLCLPEIRVAEDKKRAAWELLALVNEQLWLGHFDIWSSGGVLVYRHGLMLGDEGLLSLSQAQALIETAIDECDRFYPAFQFVLWGDKSPRDALESAMVDAAGEA